MLNGVLDKFFKGRGSTTAAPEKETETRLEGDHVEEENVSSAPAEEASPKMSAEELCSLQDKMTPGEMKSHLAALYRRHNRAAGSLDPKLRAEANQMLEAIVEVRHRYLDQKED